MKKKTMRYDLQVIASWIKPGSKVLDLGCGEGELLLHLKKEKRILGTGIESSEAKVEKCFDKGLQVLQGDITKEVRDYPDNTFDYVILSQTLQQVLEPEVLIRELLRVGKKIIVSFPNFSYWSIRLQILFFGYAPKNRQLPHEWYNTPNIRIITIKDFRRFVKDTGCRVLKEVDINTHSDDLQGKIVRFLPNLRATYGIFLVSRKNN
ncbi:MAG: methionine biosynthesis protein MetW [Desulfurivibrionaceae bacterium]|nr:methionine biosynthesis protein MetW [Desulfobulbales bacterium]MDT8334779.1 methionine biosynthesis protein MetW [Desulfurivibrionaceae bacterium]